jgi:hypothetical protein
MSDRSDYDIKFKEVKENFTIEAFFEQNMGQAPRSFATGIRFRGCPDCGVSKDPASYRVEVSKKANGSTRWKCYSCGEGGDVLDAASKFYSCSTREAATRLVGSIGISGGIKKWKAKSVSSAPEAPKRDDAAVHAVIKKLIDARLPMTNLVKEYFKGRGFSESLIQDAQNRGMLVALPTQPNASKAMLYELCGEELLLKAGMLKEGSRAPACAFRNFAFITHGAKAIEFRLARALREGETKWISYGPMSPFFWQGEGDEAQAYVLTEGMSDLLSGVALGTKKSIIGMPGCKRWNPYWFRKMAGKLVVTAFDADQAGVNALNGAKKKTAEEIAAIENEEFRLREMGLIATLQHFGANVQPFTFREDFLAETPDDQKDLNGYLKWLLKSKGLL